MSSIREEIAALYRYGRAGTSAEYLDYSQVLAIIDAHEQKAEPCKIVEGDHSISGEKWCGTHTQWHEKCHKPSDERPARAVDVMAFTEIARQKAVTFGNYQGAVCELADAIDAIATAVLEGRK